MSDHDMNDPRPTGPVEPTSGGAEAGHGWRPSAATPGQPSDEQRGAGGEPPAADAVQGAGSPAGNAAQGPGSPVAQPSDETTNPQPYQGATWPPQTYGQQFGATSAPDATPGSGASPSTGPSTGAIPMGGAVPTSGAASAATPESGAGQGATGGWPAASYQPGGYQPGNYPVGGYPTAQYSQAGSQPGGYAQPGYPYASYQPGGDPSTGASYPGAATTGAGYAAAYQPAPGHNDRPRGRAATKIAAIVLGVALALGGGIIGAAWMHHLDGNNVTTTAAVGEGGAPDNAPIIDRSSLASIAAAVRPSVVSIATSSATGSGVIISSDGYILTNNHVAATANGSNVDITLSDGSNVKGKLIGTDPKTDLAVYQAQGLSKALTPAKFGDSNALRVGDTVLAIGSPLGLDGSVTSGIVSALNRTIDESSDQQPPQNPFGGQGQNQNATPGATIAGAIQTDAAINPGNSGGALVNTNGEVVGINTAIATDGSDGNIGVGFAIPSNRAESVSQDLIKGVAVQHPFLGIAVQTATGNGGAQVQQVQSGSPAATAGLKTGDVITAYNGKAVHTSDDLVNDVQAGNVNDKVALTVERGGSSTQITVTLGESK